MAKSSTRQLVQKVKDELGDRDRNISSLKGVEVRLDACLNVLLDILLLNEQYTKPASYTEKSAYLESIGMELADISEVVGRPSNWVSSRLREFKSRKRHKVVRSKRETLSESSTQSDIGGQNE